MIQRAIYLLLAALISFSKAGLCAEAPFPPMVLIKDSTATININYVNNYGISIRDLALTKESARYGGEWLIQNIKIGYIASRFDIPAGCKVTVFPKPNFELYTSGKFQYADGWHHVDFPTEPVVLTKNTDPLTPNAPDFAASSATRMTFMAESLKIRCYAADLPLEKSYNCDRSPSVVHAFERIAGKQCEQFTKLDWDSVVGIVYRSTLNDKFDDKRPDGVKRLLRGMHSLQTLYLSSTKITSLPKDTFTDNPDLKKLDLSDNDVALPPGLFDGISLETLDISNNKQIDSLQLLSIKQPKLTYLNAYSLPNAVIQPRFFAGFPLLVHLNASSTKWDEADHSAERILSDINGIPSLEWLNISGVIPEPPMVSYIDESISERERAILGDMRFRYVPRFDLDPGFSFSLPKLKYLGFTWNYLQSIPSSLLKQSKAIQYVYLSNNLISNIGDRAFADFDNIEALSLSANRLTSLDPQLFSNSLKLKLIFLDINQLKSLPQGLLHGLANIEAVYIDAKTTFPVGMESGDKIKF
jgi:Leucine-rich repeat (LRR) protein